MSDATPTLPAVLGLGVLGAVGVALFLARESLDWNEWGPPLVVFGGAVVGGLGLAVTMGRDEEEAGAVEAAGHTEDLTRRRADALQALAALESQESQMSPEDYQAERRALLTMGAAAMRQLDQERTGPSSASPSLAFSTGDSVSNPNALAEGVAKLTDALTSGAIDADTYAKAVSALSAAQQAPAAPREDPLAPAAPVAPTPPSRPPVTKASSSSSGLSPQWTGAIYAAVGFALIGTLLYFVQTEAEPRREGAGMTGNQELGTGERPPASTEGAFMEAAKGNAQAALAADPNDIVALNTLTQLNFNAPQQAWTYNQKAREVEPDNADALVYEAVITTIMGMPDKAQEKFDAVLAKHPDHGPGWAYKGLTLMEAQQYAAAVAPLEKAMALGVNDHAITNALNVARAGGPVAGGGAPPAPPPQAAGGAVIASGMVDLDTSRSTFAGKKVFVSIADPASPRPPLAAIQLPPGPFPMAFSITEANKLAMGGDRPIPATVILTVRLDADGNAMPAPTDPVAKMPNVASGTTGLSLTLK